MQHIDYIIFENLDKVSLYIDILDRNLKLEGLISNTSTWDSPKEVGIDVDRKSKRYWIHRPPEEWMVHAPSSFIEETVDYNPSSKLEDTFYLYDFMNQDAEKKVLNYLLPPQSVNFKLDVNKRFPPKETFDQYGNLTNVIYYDDETIDINALGIRTVTFGNPVTEANFVYNYGTDGYLVDRDTTREWYKKDGTKGGSISKNKKYDENKGKRAGARRRQNVQNLMEKKTGTALFLNRGSTLIGGDGTFNTVKDADEYGKPLLNSLVVEFTNYVQNGEHQDLLDAINNIDTVTYDWVLDIDPYTGKTIQQLAHDTILDSVI